MDNNIRILLVVIAVLLFIALGSYWLIMRKRNSQEFKPSDSQKENPKPDQMPQEDAVATSYSLSSQEVVDSLEKLGYFSFTKPADLKNVKQEIADGYDRSKFLTTAFDEENYVGLCGRYHPCDHEALFEIGGLEEYLQQVKPIFDHLGIPLEWSDEFWSEDISIHTIVLNGKKYDAIRRNPSDDKIWSWAMKNFAEMLNDQLSIHNSPEKIYPLYSGNDGIFYILTDAQYTFICQHFSSNDIPKTVEDWWENG
jgi:hypothetical protein